MTYHAAAALGSCWPTHPDSEFFAASGLGSPKVLRLLGSNPKYRESARSQRMAVAPEERFEEMCVAAVVVAVIGPTKAVLLLPGC